MVADNRAIVFLGTPVAAATVLQRLLDDGFNVVHVVSQPDAKRGRGSTTSPSPVKALAQSRGLSVSDDLEWVRDHSQENLLGIVVAYGRLIPAALLQRVPMINIHFSLLPRWRGAAPIERALLAGDTRTGVCIMDIEPSLDTGAVYASREIPITDTSTTQSLTNELAVIGADLLVDTLRTGLPVPTPQMGEVSHAAKIARDELVINWADTAVRIHRQVRAVRAHTTIDGRRLRILESELLDGDSGLNIGEMDSECRVGTSEGIVRLVRVQPEGKSAMSAQDWWRGRSFVGSIRLGS